MILRVGNRYPRVRVDELGIVIFLAFAVWVL